MRSSARYGMQLPEAADFVDIENINACLQVLEDALPVPVLRQTNTSATAYQAEARFAGLTDGLSVLLVPTVANAAGAATLEMRKSGATLGGVKKLYDVAGVQIAAAGAVRAYVPAYCVYSAALDGGAGGWTYNPLSATVKAADIVDGAVTDAKIGSRALDDSAAAAEDILLLTDALSGLANMVKKITGKANWRTTPAQNLEQIISALGGKQATLTGAATTIAAANLTPSKALISDTEGKVAASAVSSTELGRLAGVGSNVQEQFNALATGAQRAGEATNALNLGSVAAENHMALRGTLPNGANFNDYVTNGMWIASALTSAVNPPYTPGTVYGLLEVKQRFGDAYQTFYLYGAAASVYYRASNGGVWGGWRRVWSQTLAAGKVLVLDDDGNIANSSVTTAELFQLVGASGNIQSQLNGKQATVTGAASSALAANFTAARVVVTDGSGKLTISSIDTTHLNRISGLSSEVQAQLDSKPGYAESVYSPGIFNPSGQYFNSAGDAQVEQFGDLVHVWGYVSVIDTFSYTGNARIELPYPVAGSAAYTASGLPGGSCVLSKVTFPSGAIQAGFNPIPGTSYGYVRFMRSATTPLLMQMENVAAGAVINFDCMYRRTGL